MARRTVTRSASTGRFLPKSSAGRSPRTTVTQSVPSAGNGAHRSAITGRYISSAAAARWPNTSITEGK